MVVAQVHAFAEAGAGHGMAEHVRSADDEIVDAAEPDAADHEREARPLVRVGPPLEALPVENGPELCRLEEAVDQLLRRLPHVGGRQAEIRPERAEFAHDALGMTCPVEHGGDLPVLRHHLAPDVREDVGVVLRVAGDAAVRLLLEVGRVDQQRRAAVGEGHPHLALGLDQPCAEARKVEVVVEGHVVDELHVLRMEVVPEAGHGGFRCVYRARLFVAALEDAHLLPGTGEIRGGAQAVVAAADDDDVVLLIRHGEPPA